MIGNLYNLENYGPLQELVTIGYQEISTSDLTKENYDEYFQSTLNIMRDGIENLDVQSLKIGVHFDDGNFLKLVLVDWWFNIIFWTFPIFIGDKITIEHLFNTTTIRKETIKQYFDKLIKQHILDVDFMTLNNLIDDSIYKFKYINEFSMYLCNSLNFKDTLNLMEKYPDFYESIYPNFDGVPIENIKSVGMDYAHRQIDYITKEDHCLRDAFTAKEAISAKQFKEVSVSIGTKPDGRGGIFPYITKNSFINGGVSDPESYVIDSSTGRTAQILAKINVGDSGSFARYLETNNIDTFFNDNPNYSCNTQNLLEVYIKDANWLKSYDKRYYRFKMNGPEYVLNKHTDFNLIGKTIYVRSPITCASYANGFGICKRCYGNLYYINRDINPGKIAAELLSSQYTQILLSAKHLLEAYVKKMQWNSEFYELFNVNLNTISIDEDLDVSNMYLVIDSSQIDSDSDDDDKYESSINDEDGDDDDNRKSSAPWAVYDEYITSFDVIYPNRSVVTFGTSDNNNIYLTQDLNRLLRSKAAEENNGVYTIPLKSLKSIPAIFTVKIQNKELQQTLERSMQIINRKADTSSFTKDSIIKEFITTNMEGGIFVDAVHLEVIISNQVRNPDNLFEMPKWEIPNVPYTLLALSQALSNSPSITVNLEYQRIGQTLVSPLSTKKKKPSVFDLFFMERPQDFVVNSEMISDDYIISEEDQRSV